MEIRGIKRSNDTDGITEHPKKCPNVAMNTQHRLAKVKSDDDTAMSQDLDLPGSSTHPKFCVTIEIRKDVKPPTKSMNGSDVTHQATFKDLSWRPKVLGTEAKKQAEWEKYSEWMEVEEDPDQMMEAEKAVATKQ